LEFVKVAYETEKYAVAQFSFGSDGNAWSSRRKEHVAQEPRDKKRPIPKSGVKLLSL
jgi:hypothetical protein